MSGYAWYPLNIPSLSDPFLGSNERRDRLDYDDGRFREREQDRREDDYRRDSGGSRGRNSRDRFSPEIKDVNLLPTPLIPRNQSIDMQQQNRKRNNDNWGGGSNYGNKRECFDNCRQQEGNRQQNGNSQNQQSQQAKKAATTDQEKTKNEEAKEEEVQEEKEDGATQDDEETEDLNSTKKDHQSVSSPSEFNDRPLPKAKPTCPSRTSCISKGCQRKKNKCETESSVGNCPTFHYDKPYDFRLRDWMEFATRYPLKDDVPSKALDIGCAEGWTTFKLARIFNQVKGIDISRESIDAANELKTYGKLAYTVQTEGSPASEHMDELDPVIDRSRVSFCQKDACNLPINLGQFGYVLAEHVICCLENLDKFLDKLPSLVAPGGILVITSPKNLPRGGFKDADGKNVTGFDTLERCLGKNFELIEDKPMSFFMKQTTHHAFIWKKRKSS